MLGSMVGIPHMYSITCLASSMLCIAAIGCLAKQQTASLGNTLGLAGVATGVLATLGHISVPFTVYLQVGGFWAAGCGTGLRGCWVRYRAAGLLGAVQGSMVHPYCGDFRVWG